MKFLLFGTGDYYERYKKWFDRDEVVALLDNSPKKQNTLIDGIKVLSPEEGVHLQFDAVVILSFYVKAMKTQLAELGIDEKCIYHFFDLHKLFKVKGSAIHRPVKYYGVTESFIQEKNCCKKRVLLLSHDLTLGGPALALYHAAESLCSREYEVVFASMLDGPLRQHLLERQIPVIVDENLQIQTMQEAAWVSKFDLILCNTISFYVFLSDRSAEIPMIWWLHDSSFFYDGVDKSILRQIDMRNLDIVSVGPVPRNAIQEHVPCLSIKDLLYGVVDEKKEWNASDMEQNSERFRFMTIGYIENRKGQDVLISAIKLLPKELLLKCEFYLVGQNTSLLAQQIEEEIKQIPQVVMKGTVNRDEINRLLCQTDMLICPSREDPMPTVAAEAMMHSVPCIVSDVTGTASYIHDSDDGFIFQCENAHMLADKIVWCVDNKDRLKNMGKKARKLYEKHFSMPAFEKQFLEIINEVDINGHK